MRINGTRKETLKHVFMQTTTFLLMIIVLGLISLQFACFILDRWKTWRDRKELAYVESV